MRHAPAVSVQGAAQPAWTALQTVLPALAASALGAWVAAHAQASGPAMALAALAAGAAVGWSAWRAAPGPAPALAWDGQRWSAAGRCGTLQLAVDFGAWMLVRFDADDGSRSDRWIALSAATAGPAWRPLRTAVHARAPVEDALAPSTTQPPRAG